MTQVTGKVVNIYAEDTGSTLAAEVVLGATEIVVDDAFDFEEGGGTLTIDGDLYGYTSANHDDEIITLASPATQPYAEDEPVLIDPYSSVIYAQVDLADNDEGIIAVIPSSIALTLTEGIREHFAEETVVVDDSTGSWQVQGIYAELPFIPANNVDVEAILVDVNAALETLNTVVLPALETDLFNLGLDMDELELAMTDVEVDLGTLEGKFPIGSTDIQDNAITTPKLIANAVTADKIIANAVTADKIAANAVTADKIIAGAVTTDKMTANTINGDRIITNTLSASKLIANSITADKIGANQIVAAAIAATAIDGKTITGALIQTAASGERVIIRNDGGGGIIEAYSGVSGVAWEGPAVFDPGLPTIGTQPTLLVSCGTSSAYPGVSSIRFYAGSIAYPSGHGSMLLTANVTYIGGGVNPVTYISGNTTNYGQITTSGGGIDIGPGAILLTIGGHGIFGGNVTLNGGGNLTVSHGGLITNPTHPTTTAAISCHLNASGIFYRNTSLRSEKLMIEPVGVDHMRKVLDLEPHTWVDRYASEAYADWLDTEFDNEDARKEALTFVPGLHRIPGLIVDEVESAGLPEMLIYDDITGQPSGLAYERLVAYLIPIVKQQDQKLQELTELVNSFVEQPGATLKAPKPNKK